MAAVWLDRYECRREGELPPVCMVCGEEATTTVRQQFRWCPSWVIIFILAGLLIWAILSLILTKKMTVYAPMCDQHRNHWFKRKAIACGLLLAALLPVFGGIVAAAVAANNNPRIGDIGMTMIGIGAIIFVLALIVAAVVLQTGIKTTEITDDDIRLIRVSPKFVAALREQRREDERREHERRRSRLWDEEDDRQLR